MGHEEDGFARRTPLRDVAAAQYDFDRDHIRRSVYSPSAHGELEDDNRAIRKCFRELLECKRPLPMFVTNLPEQGQRQIDAPEEKSAAA
jgi:hypothetical protein